jgi:hypothetical protein
MARIDGNDLTLGLRGKFGKQFVFKKFKNRTIAVRKADPSGITTELQTDHRSRFRLAAVYAKRSLLIPELKAEYEAMAKATDNTSAFAAAVFDFLKSVSITGILTATYSGEVGFPITITVSDLFKVKTMTVTLTDRDGTVIESGSAELLSTSVNYSYITTVSIPNISGLKIKVEITDRPGNTDMHEVTL